MGAVTFTLYLVLSLPGQDKLTQYQLPVASAEECLAMEGDLIGHLRNSESLRHGGMLQISCIINVPATSKG